MSDLSNEQAEFLRLRDHRILALDRAIIVDQEIRESRTLAAIVDSIGADSEAAMLEFAEVNPMDHMAVAALQARVFRLTYLRQTITEIRRQGEAAGAALAEESPYNEYEDE